MDTLKFKTNVKCGNCVAAVTPFLNSDSHIKTWNADLQSPERILTVTTDQSAEEVIELVKKAGYVAEEIA